MTESSDAAARRRIREDLDATLFVEAGAGTGKTSALVGRIVELVATGRASLTELAAITFTEAAAAELRERVASELEKCARDQSGDPARAARCQSALGDLDGAAITTLHGFARRLLAEHPFEAGLPPSIEVLDDIRSGVEFELRWSAFLDELLGDTAGGRWVARALWDWPAHRFELLPHPIPACCEEAG